MGTMTTERLTAQEAAAALGKHPVTIRRMMAAGTLPTIREGGRVFIPAEALAGIGQTCEHCGKRFTPARPGRNPRFCSPACRWAATYQARKAERPPAPAPDPTPAALRPYVRAALARIRNG